VRDVGYAYLSSWLGQPLFLKFHGSDPAVLESGSGLVRWMTRAIIANTALVAAVLIVALAFIGYYRTRQAGMQPSFNLR
jgi:hypothetical protein